MNLGRIYDNFKRKEWDSNPRYGKAVRRISSPVHSITLASFLHSLIPAAKVNKTWIIQNYFSLIFILPLLQLIKETQNRLYNSRSSKLKQSIQKTTLHSPSLYTACNRNLRRSACHPTRQDRKVPYMVKEHHSCCTIQDYILYSACRTLS